MRLCCSEELLWAANVMLSWMLPQVKTSQNDVMNYKFIGRYYLAHSSHAFLCLNLNC